MNTLHFPYRWVRVTLWNSLAATGRGHRTHPAMVAGILGMDTRDPRNPKAMEIAADLGVKVVMPGDPIPEGPAIIFVDAYGSVAANYLQITAETLDGRRVTLSGESVGGGNVRVDELHLGDDDVLGGVAPDDEDASFIDDCPAIPLTPDEWEGFQAVLPELSGMLDTYGPKAPLADRVQLARLAEIGVSLNLDPGRFALCLEAAVTGEAPEVIWARAVDLCRRWRIQVTEGTERSHRLKFLDGNWAQRLGQNPQRHILGELPWAIFVAAIGIQELNGSGGRVTAAPTGGASGTVPACIIRLADHLTLDETSATLGVMVSGLVGFVAFARGYVSGARAGCGGEVGIASMMAAGACAVLLGGGWREMDSAAALASLPWMGTECSPTLGLVEYPCAPRNGHGAVGALFSAVAALSVKAPYPADHHMDVIFAVGATLKEFSQERESGHHGETLLKTCNGGCDVCSLYKLGKV